MWGIRVELSLLLLLIISVSVHGKPDTGRRQSLEPSPAIAGVAGEFPYHVSIQMYDYQLKQYVHEGSGAIIDESHIVTSTFMSPSAIYSYQIVAGVLSPFDNSITRQVRNLTEIFWDPTYDYVQPDMMVNNNAVLRLDKPFEFNYFVNSIPLPPQGHVSTGKGIMTGWKPTIVALNGTDLMKLEIPLISKSDCDEYFGEYKKRSGRMCAADLGDGEEGGVYLDGDFGFDEGHPILCSDDEVIGHPYICGFFSFVSPVVEIVEGGETVFVGGYPIVFQDVASYIPWIQNHTLISDTKLQS